MIYSKKIKKHPKWEKAFQEYENISSFEPMHQEDIDANKMSIREAWCKNIEWLEDLLAEVSNIKTPIEHIED